MQGIIVLSSLLLLALAVHCTVGQGQRTCKVQAINITIFDKNCKILQPPAKWNITEDNETYRLECRCAGYSLVPIRECRKCIYPPATTTTEAGTDSTTASGPPDSTTASGPPDSTTASGPPASTTASGPPDSTTASGPPDSTTASGPPDSTTASGPPDSTTASGPPDSTTASGPPDSTTASGSSDSTTTSGPPTT